MGALRHFDGGLINEKTDKTRKQRGFSAGYPPAEKCDGTLSLITFHHGIGSVD